MDDHTVLVGRHDEHLERLPLTTISILAPFSALIMSIVFVIYFIIRFYLLEKYLLKKIYGATYTTMDETVRRGFVNHHIAGGTKILILIAAIYPFISVVFGTSNFHTRFTKSSPVTMGDVLIVVSQMLMAMYIFELFYRQYHFSLTDSRLPIPGISTPAAGD